MHKGLQVLLHTKLLEQNLRRLLGEEEGLCLFHTPTLMTNLDSILKSKDITLPTKVHLDGLGAGGEGDDRGWDGWMESPTRWIWIWVNSGSWWWTRRPGVLRFMGSQRAGHDWVTELNWTLWAVSWGQNAVAGAAIAVLCGWQWLRERMDTLSTMDFNYLQIFGLPFHPTSASITSSPPWLLITLTDSLDPHLEILIELVWGTAWHEIGVCAPGDFNEQPGMRTTAVTVSQLLFSLWILSPSHCGYPCLVPPFS